MSVLNVIRPVFRVSALTWFIRTSAAVLLVAEGVIRPVFSVSALTWFIRTCAAVEYWANDTLGD
jgi:hypothetical protein